MILYRGTQLRRELIACSHSQQGWHIIAGLHTVLIRSQLRTQGCANGLQGGRVVLHQVGLKLSPKPCLQLVLRIGDVQLRAELITGSQSERTFVEVNADNRRKAPTQLVHVELQTGQIAKHWMSVSDDMALIVTVVIVGPDAHSSREAIKNLISKVHLSAKDVLLALHLRVYFVLVGCDALSSKH